MIDHLPQTEETDKYYESDDVRHCYVDDVAILLDLRDGEYIHLDPTATVMWQALLSANRWSERYAMLNQRFGAPTSQTASDFARFTQTCLEHGYIGHEPAKQLGRSSYVFRPQISLPLLAWWLLITTKSRLVRRGFSETYRACRAVAKPTLSGTISDRNIDRFENAFALAENFFVMREAPDDCLPRSLALYRFMLACGVPVQHWIGVRTLPFRGHAWVEFGGKAIRDSQKYVDAYTRIAAL